MLKALYRFASPKFQTVFLDYKVTMIPRFGHGLPPHQGLYKIINEERESYRALLQEFGQHQAAFVSL